MSRQEGCGIASGFIAQVKTTCVLNIERGVQVNEDIQPSKSLGFFLIIEVEVDVETS